MKSCALLAVVALAGCNAIEREPEIPPPPAADLVAYGRVWTGDTAAPWAGAVAISGDTIVAVGDSATVASMRGSRSVAW